MTVSNQERQDRVFCAVVHEYLASAEPVGSGTIASKYRLSVSPATIRNDMADLEERGFLFQPHASAGRVPTEDGYRFYVETYAGENELSARRRDYLSSAIGEFERDTTACFKEFARTVSSLTEEAVFVRLDSSTVYFTGLTNLLRKPEVRESELIFSITEIFDDPDRVLALISGRAHRGVQVLIGSENPFGRAWSSVMMRCDYPDLGESIVGILGPTRMDYDSNLALIRYIHELFEKQYGE